jgi:hypothetical protein
MRRRSAAMLSRQQQTGVVEASAPPPRMAVNNMGKLWLNHGKNHISQWAPTRVKNQ